MSYIQIEIGGKLRGLKFNQMALMIFSTKTDPDEPTASSGYALIYAGLKANTYVKGEEFVDSEEKEIDGKKVTINSPITFEMVCDWYEDLKEDVILKVVQCFNGTQAFKKLIPEKDKKKLTQKSMKKNVLK